jgi:ParB-like chromosome segregation protein Spo0J
MAKTSKAEAVPSARVLGEGVAAVYLPVDALKPNPRNPRIHGAEVTKLARTILRTTWGAPVIAQASTLRIIGGHGRLEAAKLILAGVEVDGILRGGADHRFDRGAPGPALVPVRLVDVSDAEAEAMTLADNASALQGRDDASLAVEMATRSFERGAPLMADMGYGADDLDRMVRAAGDAVLRDAAPSGEGTPAGDAATEWEGMPEFDQPDKTAHRSVIVHFRRAEDVDAFLAALNISLTSGAKYTWYPPESLRDLKSLAYAAP